MDQRPLPDATPLEPPTPEVARAFIDESLRIAQRREEHIDRRASARLLVIEGIVLATYITPLMFIGLSSGTAWMALFVPLMVWTMLAGMLGEMTGFRPGGREAVRLRVVGLILVLVCLGALATVGIFNVDLPVTARFAPGVFALLVYVVMATRLWRQGASDIPVSRPRLPFDPQARRATILLGGALGVSIVIAGAGPDVPAVTWLVVTAMLVGIGIWCLRIAGAAASPVALYWGATEWALFAIAGCAVVAFVMLGTFVEGTMMVPAVVAGAIVVAGYIVDVFVWRKRG